MKYEPWRFLVDTNAKNRSVIQWQPDPHGPISNITLDEAKHLLGFKTVRVHKRAAYVGLSPTWLNAPSRERWNTSNLEGSA